MGKVIKSTCRACQYQNKFNFGGAKTDFQRNKPVPALNLKTGEFENINFFTHKYDPDYLFYSDGLLKNSSESQTFLSDFDFVINKKSNYCPNCKGFTLDFNYVSFYD